MATNNRGNRYDEDFKRTLVNLYQSGDKAQAALCKEYGIAPMTLNRWTRQYSTVEVSDGEILTAYKLRFQHNIKLLCKVLRVNRSSFYKHFYSKPAPRTKENQQISKLILQILC
jgi:putative transposase